VVTPQDASASVVAMYIACVVSLWFDLAIMFLEAESKTLSGSVEWQDNVEVGKRCGILA